MPVSEDREFSCRHSFKFLPETSLLHSVSDQARKQHRTYQRKTLEQQSVTLFIIGKTKKPLRYSLAGEGINIALASNKIIQALVSRGAC